MTSAVAGLCELEGCFTHLVFLSAIGHDMGQGLASEKKKKKRKKRLIFSEKAMRQNCYDSHSSKISK